MLIWSVPFSRLFFHTHRVLHRSFYQIGAYSTQVLVTDIASDGKHYVAHTKGYVQVLLQATEGLMGATALVRVSEAAKFYVRACVLEIVYMPPRPLKLEGEVAVRTPAKKMALSAGHKFSGDWSGESDFMEEGNRPETGKTVAEGCSQSCDCINSGPNEATHPGPSKCASGEQAKPSCNGDTSNAQSRRKADTPVVANGTVTHSQAAQSKCPMNAIMRHLLHHWKSMPLAFSVICVAVSSLVMLRGSRLLSSRSS